MSTLHSSFHSSTPGSMSAFVPPVTNNLRHPPNSQGSADPKPVFTEDVLGYVYLCCQSNKARAELLSVSSHQGHYAGLGAVSDILSSHELKPGTPVPPHVLQGVLAAAKITPELWSVTVQRVTTSPTGRAILNQANAAGESLMLGLPADASPRLRKIERTLQTTQFATHEAKRISQALHSHATRAVDPKKNKVLLYAVKVRAASEVPPDGFSKHSLQLRWLLGAAVVKLRGTLASLTTTRERSDRNEHIQAAKHRSWLAPAGASIKSPSIQELVKLLAASRIETKINTIPGTRGCSLELEFWVSPGQLLNHAAPRKRS